MTLRIFLLHTKKITLGVSLAPPSAPRVSPSEPSLGEQGASWEQSCFENQRSSSGEQQFSRHQLRCGQAPAQLRGVPGLGLHSTSERCPVSTPSSGEEPQKEKWPVERSKLCLWRPLTRSAGRACVGPGSGGAVGDKLPSEGLSQWFHQCVLLQRGEGRGIETHTPNRSREG